MSQDKQRLYIDAMPLMGNNPSGIGKLLLGHITELAKNNDFLARYKLVLFVSLRKAHKLRQWNLPEHIIVRELPVPLKVINLLFKLGLMPPIDLMLGRGIYLFGNYRRLPLIRSRSLTFVHDAVYNIYPETVEPRNRKHLQIVVPNAFRKSDRVLTLSNESRRELAAIFPHSASKLRIVPCAINKSHYTLRTDKVLQTTLQKVGVVRKKFLLYVGNIEPRKNINYLLDVYVELIRQKTILPDTTLLLVGGDGWNNEPLLARIKELTEAGAHIVRPLYRLDDQSIADLYQVSLLTCLFSLHEGFGLTPLEAMAAGSKAAVSDLKIFHEVNKDAVTYVPLNNVTLAAKRIQKALSSSRNERAVTAVLNTYSWHHASTELIKCIDEL